MTGPEYASKVLAKEPSPRSATAALAAAKIADEKKTPIDLSSRHFNTSRTLKAPNDTSAIDLTFLPTSISSPSDVDVDVSSQIRVPILPTTIPIRNPQPTAEQHHAAEPVVMKPTISSMSADTVFLPLAEISDGHAMNIDFHAMADRVAANLRHLKAPVEQQASIMKQIWSDMIDDVVGGEKLTSA